MLMAAHGCVVPDSPLTLSALNDISKLLSKCDWAMANTHHHYTVDYSDIMF